MLLHFLSESSLQRGLIRIALPGVLKPLDLFQSIQVLHVVRVTCGHQKVIQAIQVDIHEDGTPGPS